MPKAIGPHMLAFLVVAIVSTRGFFHHINGENTRLLAINQHTFI